MPNIAREKDTIDLRLTMAGLARLHDRYLRGMQHGMVLGDALEKDYRWIGEIERVLLGNGYYDAADIQKVHQMVNVNWKPEFDKE